jgi:hypothetical protein
MGTWGRRLCLPALAVAALPVAPALAADNLPPEITVPAAQTTNEDTARAFSSGNSNAITVSDPDSDPDDIRVTLTATNGRITLATTAGLSFGVGDGTADATMTFDGTVAEVNAALEGMTFTPDQDYNGTGGLLEVDADDLGHNGDPPAETDSDSVAITVNAVNDNPVNAVPGTQAMDENTVDVPSSLTLSTANSSAISTSDVDAGSAVIRVTLNTAPPGFDNDRTGRLTLASTAGLTFTNGDGVSDETVTFEGTIADINAALGAGVAYVPTTNRNGTGSGSVKIITNDLANTGTGGSKQDTDFVAVDIAPVNSAPDNMIPPALGTYRGVDKPMSLGNLNNISIKEWDNDDSVPLGFSIGVDHGTLTLASTTGLTPTSGANGTGAMGFSGTWQAVNAALENVTFSPPDGFSGDVTITMTSDELSGVTPLGDDDTGTIRVDVPEEAIYWATSKNTLGGIPGGLGRAELDGGGGAFLANGPELADIPIGTAIDAAEGRIYWSITPTSTGDGSIYSANLDGTDKQLFLSSDFEPVTTKMNAVNGLAIDQETRRIYWGNHNALPAGTADRGISYVSLDAPTDDSQAGFIPPLVPSTSSPRAITLDREHDRVYWTNVSNSSLGYAPLPGASGTTGTFTVTGTVTQAQGVAVDLDSNPERLFWSNGAGDTADQRLKVADLQDPFSPSITAAAHPLTPLTGGGLRTPAIDQDANRVYFANSATNQISHVNLDAAGGNGANVTTATGTVNSPDGVSILKQPEPDEPPAISGTAEVGSTLTCAAATWASDQPNASLYRVPASTAFKWTRDGAEIPGATGSTYAPTAAGEHRCVSTATNFAGTSSQTSDPVSVAAAPAPGNDIVIGKAKSNSRKGTAVLPVEVPGAGTLTLSGAGVKSASAAASGPGTVNLTVKASGKAAKKLRSKGKAGVSVAVTFTPTGGEANTETAKLGLVKIKLKQR